MFPNPEILVCHGNGISDCCHGSHEVSLTEQRLRLFGRKGGFRHERVTSTSSRTSCSYQFFEIEAKLGRGLCGALGLEDSCTSPSDVEAKKLVPTPTFIMMRDGINDNYFKGAAKTNEEKAPAQFLGPEEGTESCLSQHCKL